MAEQQNEVTGTIESRFLKQGDRIVVEPAGADTFEATVERCLGWSFVHGVMAWEMRKDNGDLFGYDIHVNAPVRVVTA